MPEGHSGQDRDRSRQPQGPQAQAGARGSAGSGVVQPGPIRSGEEARPASGSASGEVPTRAARDRGSDGDETAGRAGPRDVRGQGAAQRGANGSTDPAARAVRRAGAGSRPAAGVGPGTRPRGQRSARPQRTDQSARSHEPGEGIVHEPGHGLLPLPSCSASGLRRRGLVRRRRAGPRSP